MEKSSTKIKVLCFLAAELIAASGAKRVPGKYKFYIRLYVYFSEFRRGRAAANNL